MSVVSQLLKELERALAATAGRGDDVVVACSGGPDSMALVHLLVALRSTHRPNLRIVVAHLDHGLRGEESAGDRRFVETESAGLGLECHAAKAETGLGREPGASLEEAARRERYQFLTQVAVQTDSGLVLTAHTREDAAETFLLRVLRGAGRTGLCGLRRNRPLCRGVELLRPLLSCGRDDLRAYLKQEHLTWRVDSSNADERFDRNRLRAQLVPAMEGFSTGAMDRLARASQILMVEEEYLESEAAILAQTQVSSGSRGFPRLARQGFLSAPAALQPRLLRRLIESTRGGLRRIGTAHLDELAGILEAGSGQMDLPGGWRAQASAEGLEILPVEGGIRTGEASPAGFCYEVAVPGRVRTPSGYLLEASELDQVPGPDEIRRLSPGVAVLDAARSQGLLVIRSRRPGDRIRPLGMAGRSKKVKDLLVDRKIPRQVRDGLPVVEVAGEVAWIGGVAVGEHFRVRPGTSRAVQLVLEADPSMTDSRAEG